MTPKNWNEFQHYKDRKPPWIKLHRALLDDYAFACLPLASQALAPRLWLLASEYPNGKITANLDEIAFRVHVTVDVLTDALKPLVNTGFFIDDSGMLAACKQVAIPEREREEETQVEKKGENIPSLRSGAGTQVIVSRRTVRKATKLPLPDDWSPNDMHRIAANRLKLPAELVESKAEDMRIWAGSNDIRRANWDLTFHGFLKRAANEGFGNGQRGPGKLQATSGGNIIPAQQKLIERIDSFGRPPEIRSGQGASVVRLLPEGGCERSGDVHSGDNGDPCGIPNRSDPARH